MEKKEAYAEIVKMRKQCACCLSLTNPASPQYQQFDSEHVGPWSRWQHDLDASVVLVGQDWGDTAYFMKYHGIDQASGNTTNKNLQKLLSSIGIEVRKPREEQAQVVFLTNLILCLKEGGLQAPVKPEWLAQCAEGFFRPLLDLIQPHAVVALGEKVAKAILTAFKVPHLKKISLLDLMHQGPYELAERTMLFPVYHCGAKCINMNRPLVEQVEDWRPIKRWLQEKT